MDRPLQHRLFQQEHAPYREPSASQSLDDSTEEEEEFLDDETTSDYDNDDEEEEEKPVVETMAATVARQQQKKPGTATTTTNARGRWTAEEHERFLRGLELYGKNWRPISTHVQTRTTLQVRTHAQKYFAMLPRVVGDWRKIGATYHATTTSSRNQTSAAAGGGEKRGEQRVIQRLNKKTPAAAAPPPAAKRKRKVPVAAEMHQTVEEEEEEIKEVDSSSEPFWLNYKTTVASTRTATAAAAISAPKRMIVWPSNGDDHHDDNQIVVPIVAAAVTTAGGGGGDATAPPPTTASSSRTRGSLEYVDLMKANCSIFHALPSADQEVFVRNFAHFLTTVRGRHFVTANPTGKTISVAVEEDWHNKGQCLLLQPPASLLHAMIAGEFRLDVLKMAALQFHPYWLLGEHDAAQLHRDTPFVHRHHHNHHLGPDDDEESSSSSSWRPVTIDRVRDILDGEGPKNLLLLPPLIIWESGQGQNTVPAPPPPPPKNNNNDNNGRQNHVWYCHEQ